MRIEGSERVALPLGTVWRGLDDPAVLRACTPGLASLERRDEDHYDAVLELKIPALSGRFEGSVDIVEREAPHRMKVRIRGKGAPGFIDGEADLRLVQADGGTEVRYVADVQVGGQVARLGQRMISGVTKEMAGQFFETFARAGAPAATEGREVPHIAAKPPNALFAFLKLAWRTVLNLLGLSRRS
jgi:carbon monoxide dehydrogenase subunit G